MLAAQGAVCVICRRPPKENQQLCVDHCHKSGVVRALLCISCNSGLGFYEAFHERLAKYLVDYGAGNALLNPPDGT